MTKSKKIYIITFCLMVIISAGFGVVAQAATVSSNVGVNVLNFNVPTDLTSDFSAVRTTCGKFSGFFNKIVKCITSMTTREGVFFNIWKLSNVFSGAATAALIIYIVFFGLRMSLNALESSRNDIIVFLLTCFFITFVNSHTRIIDVLKFFMTVQNEFAYAATAAMYSSDDAKLAKDVKGQLTGDPATDAEIEAGGGGTPVMSPDEINSKYPCYGPRMGPHKIPQPGIYYNIWQRMDCLVVYMMGAHPVVERLTQYSTATGEIGVLDDLNSNASSPVPAAGGTVTAAASQSLNNAVAQTVTNFLNQLGSSNGAQNVGSFNEKYSYGLFDAQQSQCSNIDPEAVDKDNKTSARPFSNQAEEPYCWFKQSIDVDYLIDGDITVADAIRLKNSLGDICFIRALGITSQMEDDIADMASPPVQTGPVVTTPGGSEEVKQQIIDLAKNFVLNSLGKPRPTKGDKYQITMGFSFVTILLGSLFSSGFGLATFIAGFTVIFLMFFAFAQAVMVYVTSLFAILVLGMFAPIIIPLFLFKNTRGIFENWLQMFFTYALQPGIILCYITLMILVLQFVVFKKHDINVSGRINKISYVDLILGKKYTCASKARQNAIDFYEKLVSGKDYSPAGAANTGDNAINPYTQSSIYGTGDAQYYVAGANEVAADQKNAVSSGGFQTNSTGSNSSSVTLPSFSFFGSSFDSQGAAGSMGGIGNRMNAVNAAIRDLIKYQPSVADISRLTMDIFKGLAPEKQMQLIGLYDCKKEQSPSMVWKCRSAAGWETVDSKPDGNPDFANWHGGLANPAVIAQERYKQLKTEQVTYNSLLIQSIFLILIVLAITITFLHTVMNLAGKIAGAGATPIGKATQVYDIMAGKLQKTMRGG